jgi:hypothetical protein
MFNINITAIYGLKVPYNAIFLGKGKSHPALDESMETGDYVICGYPIRVDYYDQFVFIVLSSAEMPETASWMHVKPIRGSTLSTTGDLLEALDGVPYEFGMFVLADPN